MTATDTLARLHAAIPTAGLFAEKDWLLSPEPLRLDAAFIEELEKLGHRLTIFQRAQNELYHRSVNGKLTIGPTASYQYTNVRLDGFTEAGAFLPLIVAGQTTESSRSSLGFHATYDTHVGKYPVRPEARLSWQHEFGATASSITSRFANIGGNPFTVTGPKIGRDSLLVGAGLSVQWSPRCASYLYYDGEVGRTNYNSHSISGGFRFQF